MVCDAVRPVIRQFMDDLLDEKDYQAIHAHLVSCKRCHTFASSVGTLSYRLYELGQTTLPPDMVSAILYELKKVPVKTEAESVPSRFPEASRAEAFTTRTRSFWIAVAVLAAVSIAAIATVFFWKTQRTPDMTPPTRTDHGTPPAVSFSPERLMERHFHLALSGRPELAKLIIDLQLAIERDSDRSIIFMVPAEKSSSFLEGVTSFSREVKEFGESGFMEDAKDERVTVFFE